jgi:hypothetical protein
MKHLYPVPGVFLHHAPAIEQDVDDETAAELLSYFPPAFTLTPPAGVKAKPKRVRKPKKPAAAAAPVEGE